MGWELLILLRPQILLFFLLGILTRRLALDGRATAVPTLPLALVFLSLAATKVALAASGNDYETSRPEMIALFDNRSEEHTSELQSLMRISYDVFCLKKKKTNK